MKYRYALVIACIAMISLSSAVAQASPPVKNPPSVGSFDIPLPSAICGFDIVVHFDVKQHSRTFANGVSATEGSLKGTVSGNGKSIDVNFSGPGTLTPNLDGTFSLRAEGTNLVFFFPGELGPGQPGALYLTHGLVTETLTNTGPVPGTFSTTGSVTDLCAALA